ncbi:MAG: BolA family transcriptional regulator [Gammaproteobacteria bacterium]|nr:BolA family transcriptional regulator [Gammaproteobacteria bacterium]|tara:strand:- start:17 stop:286 length:270 start_codon:yes stop_codon:yes gene_type:complete
MSEKRINLIKESLNQLNPVEIKIIDQGHLHIGHAGAKKGGHFDLYITSTKFDGLNILERHQLIYKCVSTLMNGEIHALSIKSAISPNDC